MTWNLSQVKPTLLSDSTSPNSSRRDFSDSWLSVAILQFLGSSKLDGWDNEGKPRIVETCHLRTFDKAPDSGTIAELLITCRSRLNFAMIVCELSGAGQDESAHERRKKAMFREILYVLL
jgi:hypothetical protein